MTTQLMTLSILVVEDQLNIAQNIAQYMEVRGHVLDFADNGKQGLSLALTNHYDVIVLDLNLPQLDGLSVCEQLRKNADRHIPILMLTARDSLDDKVNGFTVGADDYLTKPFSLQELEVRCHALSRRHLLQTSNTIELGSLVVDRQRQIVTRDGQQIKLHNMGFKIIKILAEAYPKVISKSQLTQQLWGDEPTESDALRSHIYQLRSALDKPFDKAMLKTVHGVGFTLDIADDNH